MRAPPALSAGTKTHEKEMKMTILNNALFWISVSLNVISIYKMYLSRRMTDFRARKLVIDPIAYKIVFVSAAFTAVLIRTYQFGLIPGGFNLDGAMAAVDAKALADYGTDRFGMSFPVHLTAWGYGQMSALLSYLMIPFIKLFGFSPVTVRLPQLLVSMMGICFLYLFIRDAFDKNIALLVFLFTAINPWHILQSRWTIDCNLYPHFFMAGIYFLYLATKRKHRLLHLSVSMVMFGLCMYCYGISIYTVPVFLVAACIYLLFTRKLSILNAVFALVIYLLTAWPFIAVMAINFFQLDTIRIACFTLPYFPDSIRSNDIIFFSPDFFRQLVENFKSLVRVTALQTKDLPWNDVQNFGTMYLFSFPFAVTGFCGIFYEFRKKVGAMFVLFFLGTGIWCGLVTNNVNVNRLNIIYYPIIILAGIGIYEVICWISLPRIEYGMAAVYALVFLLFAKTYFTSYAVQMDIVFSKDFGDAVCSVKDSDADRFYITISGQGNSMISEIRTMFWLEIDAEYFQGRVSEGERPYNEKYVYKDIHELTIDPAENAVYVIAAGELDCFDDSLYEFEQFGTYYTVTKKGSR